MLLTRRMEIWSAYLLPPCLSPPDSACQEYRALKPLAARNNLPPVHEQGEGLRDHQLQNLVTPPWPPDSVKEECGQGMPYMVLHLPFNVPETFDQ